MSLPLIRRPGNPAPASEIAAQWVLRQEQGPLSDREQHQFEAWLAEDLDHVTAYEDAVWALDATGRHASEPELMAMRDAALAARSEPRHRGWIWGGIGGAIAAAAASAWLFTMAPSALNTSPATSASAGQAADPRTATYATAIGERLAVTLPDGSIATLDTNSELRVAYSNAERGVHLLRGQALFEVANNKPLPFQVHAAGQRIVAVGTVFNVRLDGDRVKVALVEGAVRVGPDRAAAGTEPAARPEQHPIQDVTMRAGEVLELGPARPALVRPADVSQVASWTGGELVFNDVRLAEAVAEINRYTRRPIVIADPAVGDHRVTGVFRSNDPEHFSRAMAEVFPIELGHLPNGAPVLRAEN